MKGYSYRTYKYVKIDRIFVRKQPELSISRLKTKITRYFMMTVIFEKQCEVNYVTL